MRIRKGFIVFSANKKVDLAVKAKAPAPESLIKRRRVVCIRNLPVVPAEKPVQSHRKKV
jgi:hypothetical protein